MGGIYQVIKSKAALSCEELGYSKYVLFGVKYNDRVIHTEVEPCDLKNETMMKAVDAMRLRGVKIITGKWLIEGLPQVVLFDLNSVAGYLDEWRAEFYNKTHISGPFTDKEFNDTILYGFACAWFIGEWIHQYELVHELAPLTICHFHEWLSGVGLIMARTRKVRSIDSIC